MSKAQWLSKRVKGLLMDISGVLKDGDVVIPGSVEAVKKLQEKGFPFCLVTNETLKPRKTIENTLKMLGYKATANSMFTPIPAMIEVLKKEKLRPHLLLHERMLVEFEGIDTSNPNCVVLGDAEQYFTYNNLNMCFRKLMDMEKPILFTLGLGKYYLDDDGLALDVGAYCKALEYSTGIKARVIGKPSPDFFKTAVSHLGLQPHEVVMIGDDVQFDVGGAQSCGLRGILVRTGKYRPDDENHSIVKPDGVVNNLKEAVDILLTQNWDQ